MLVNWKEAEQLRRSVTYRPGRGFRPFARFDHPDLFKPRRSPNRVASMERRRLLAYSGPIGRHLGKHFTLGEMAVLRIVGDEFRWQCRCTEFLDAIAARAGVSRSTAKNALRKAKALGLVNVVERRITGTKNDSNVITVISPEWLKWLRRKGSNVREARITLENIGVKQLTTTGTLDSERRLASKKTQNSDHGRDGFP